jgi:hypothetical protein
MLLLIVFLSEKLLISTPNLKFPMTLLSATMISCDAPIAIPSRRFACAKFLSSRTFED